MTPETAVSVTAGHIRAGEPGEPCACPIALAILDEFADYEYTSAGVFCTRARLFTGGARYQASLPQSARDFIGRYDNALPVEPFGFTLRWEPES